MTVIPFSARSRQHVTPNGRAGACITPVTGWFRSPSGRVGTFTGTFRLETLAVRNGRLTAAGVFTGELTDADGRRVGIGARRRTCRVEALDAAGQALIARIEPASVDLLGLVVTVERARLELPMTPGLSTWWRLTSTPALRATEPLGCR